MNAICTVLTGTKYNVNCVNVLYEQLKMHSTIPFVFYCYTDVKGEFAEDIKIIPIIKKNKKLQWYKLDFFKKDIIEEKDIVLMDIDQSIVGNCDFLFDEIHDNEFRGTHRFWWRWREDIAEKQYALSGSVYHFKTGKHQYIIDEFEKDINFWQEYFIQNKIVVGPVNGEQHFVQRSIENNNTNFTVFPEKNIIKWHEDDVHTQMELEKDYYRYTGNEYILRETWHEDVRIVHYAGN